MPLNPTLVAASRRLPHLVLVSLTLYVLDRATVALPGDPHLAWTWKILVWSGIAYLLGTAIAPAMQRAWPTVRKGLCASWELLRISAHVGRWKGQPRWLNDSVNVMGATAMYMLRWWMTSMIFSCLVYILLRLASDGDVVAAGRRTAVLFVLVLVSTVGSGFARRSIIHIRRDLTSRWARALLRPL